jgi:hypothetical protein
MAYVDNAIDVWKFEQNRDQNARRNFGQSLSNLAGAIDENRQRALATQRAKENQALALSKDGVNPDDISAYQNDGDMGGIQQFYADQNEKQRILAAAKADRDARLAESQIGKNNRYEPPGNKNGDLSFEDKEKIKSKYRAQNKQEAQPAQNEFAAAGYAKRARQAEADLAKLPANIGTDWKSRLANILPNEMVPQDLQLLQQAKRNFISANLRKESGAAISNQEYESEDKKYFPQPGDSEAVLAQKAKAREQAMLNLEAEGARALPKVKTAEGADQSQQKPKTVIQNGHTYILNEQTGEYE